MRAESQFKEEGDFELLWCEQALSLIKYVLNSGILDNAAQKSNDYGARRKLTLLRKQIRTVKASLQEKIAENEQDEDDEDDEDGDSK